MRVHDAQRSFVGDTEGDVLRDASSRSTEQFSMPFDRVELSEVDGPCPPVLDDDCAETLTVAVMLHDDHSAQPGSQNRAAVATLGQRGHQRYGQLRSGDVAAEPDRA